MLFRIKKDVIGSFQDEKGVSYKLIRENQKRWLDKKGEGVETILFYRGNEVIPSWEAYKLKLDMSNSNKIAVAHFITDYLKSSSNIKNCLQRIRFPIENVIDVWNGVHQDNKFMKETILQYQDILSYFDFIQGLPYEDKWVVLTQNIHRTNEKMEMYQHTFQEVIAFFLHHYLSTRNIEKYEQIYGEWKTLVLQTFQAYYSDIAKEETIQLAIGLTQQEIEGYERELKNVQEKMALLDKEYEESALSQKLKIEEQMKEVVEIERKTLEEIQFANDKIQRIQSFF